MQLVICASPAYLQAHGAPDSIAALPQGAQDEITLDREAGPVGRPLESLGLPLKGGIELHFTYDEEFGGELGPGWLLAKGLTQATQAQIPYVMGQMAVKNSVTLVNGGTVDEFVKFQRDDMARTQKLITEGNIRVE